MSDYDGVDFVISSPDNDAQDGADDTEILIKKSELEPLNDPNCKHENVTRDDTEELGTAFSCNDCGRGWLFDKVDSPT